MKALVTGGAGFIGSHLVENLLQDGYEVIVFDNLTSGSLDNLAAVTSDIEVIADDIRNFEALLMALNGVDHVFHLAALTSVPKSMANPVLTHEVNVAGTLNVLWASLKADISRVVLASSCAIYGDAQQPPVSEHCLPVPKSPYAASKLQNEALATSFYFAYNLETVCLRYFNVYGPRQKADSDYAAVIPRFVQCYCQGRSPIVYGDGTQSRDFIHITDIARANILAARLNRDVLKEHRVFNVGTSTGTSLLTLLEVLSIRFEKYLEPDFHPSRVGDILHSWADMDLASQCLGFTPQVSLEIGIQTL